MLRKSLIFVPRLAAFVFELGAVLAIARSLGLLSLGRYQLVLVTSMLVFLLADRGRNQLGLNIVAHNRSWRGYCDLSSRRNIQAAAAVGLSGMVLVAGHGLLGGGLAALGGLLLERRWALFALHKQFALTISYLVRPALVLAALAAGVHTAAQLLYCNLAAAILVTLLDRRAAWRGLNVEERGSLVDALDQRPRGSFTLASANVIAHGYAAADLLLVVWLAGAEQAGLYALAYRPIAGLLVLIGYLRDQWISAPPTPQGQSDRLSLPEAIGMLLMCGTPYAALLIFLKPLQHAVPSAIGADRVSTILLLSLPPLLIGGHAYARLLGVSRFRPILWSVSAAAISSIGLNLVLTPQLGAQGAATATVLAELVAAVTLIVARRTWGGSR